MHELPPHEAGAAQSAVGRVVAGAERLQGNVVRFEYRLTGMLADLAVPLRAAPQRSDGLWEHTCFEAFLAPAGESRYYELNFSPSTAWAAYSFDAYRQGMQLLELEQPPTITVTTTPYELDVTATVVVPGLAGRGLPWRLGLTAVVEGRDGVKGYYALRHPGARPDFHAAEGFTALLDGNAR